MFIATLARCSSLGFAGCPLRLGRLAAVSFSFNCAKAQSTLAGGLKPTTLSRLHKYTQANRAYCFTVARKHPQSRLTRFRFNSPYVRALSSTARVGTKPPTGKKLRGYLLVTGGKGWSRTTVLGFSDRHTDRVCHLPI